MPTSQGELQPRITVDRFVRGLSQHIRFEDMGMNRNRFLRTFQRGFHHYLVRYSLQHSEKKVMIDKITPYRNSSPLVVESIELFFPQAKVVHLIRDGRDVATSGTFDWILRDAQGTDRYSYFCEQRPDLHLQRFFDDEALRKWAEHWIEPSKAIAESTLPQMEIRYEEMIEDQATVIVRICEYLAIPCSDEIANHCRDQVAFEKATGRKQGEADHFAKSRKGIVGDWHNYFTRRDGELFQELTEGYLQKMGYEEREDWVFGTSRIAQSPSHHGLIYFFSEKPAQENNRTSFLM